MDETALDVVVRDEDSGEAVRITAEMKLDADRVHENVVHHDRLAGEHMFALGVALKRMRDERLYLALGLRSFSAYCEGFQLSRQVAYDRIAAAESEERLKHSDFVKPVRQVSYTNALLMARASPEDSAAVASKYDVSTMKKADVARVLAEAKTAREEAAAANRRADDQARRAEQAVSELAKSQQTAEAALQEAKKAKAELQARPVVEIPVDKPVLVEDAEARAEADRLREANNRLIQTYGSIEQLRAEQRALQDQNAEHQAEQARIAHLQEEALRINKSLRELQDVIVHNRSVFETAKAREYGDWLDLQGIYDTESLMQAILRDFHRIAKDCVRK